MIKINTLFASVVAAGLLFGAGSAQAHCDSVDGPVAKAAQKPVPVPKMRRAAWVMLRKYRVQLGTLGIDYAAIPEPIPAVAPSPQAARLAPWSSE